MRRNCGRIFRLDTVILRPGWLLPCPKNRTQLRKDSNCPNDLAPFVSFSVSHASVCYVEFAVVVYLEFRFHHGKLWEDHCEASPGRAQQRKNHPPDDPLRDRSLRGSESFPVSPRIEVIWTKSPIKRLLKLDSKTYEALDTEKHNYNFPTPGGRIGNLPQWTVLDGTILFVASSFSRNASPLEAG